MPEGRIEVTADGAVGRIWLNRKEARNALDGALVAELHEAVEALVAQDAVRVLVLGARGPVFCAGADLAWMKTVAGFSRAENVADARALAALYEAIDSAPKPVVARVHGAALGGGAGLVAVADIAVAATGTQFGFTEVRLGLIPAVISPYVLRKTGVAAARELFLTGARFDATKALAMGLVTEFVPEADLDAAVDARVRELLQAAPGAIAAAKALIRDVAAGERGEIRPSTVERIADRRASEEGQEGMRAFLEKRKPRWAR